MRQSHTALRRSGHDRKSLVSDSLGEVPARQAATESSETRLVAETPDIIELLSACGASNGDAIGLKFQREVVPKLASLDSDELLRLSGALLACDHIAEARYTAMTAFQRLRVEENA